jgi:hypothetical protein
MSPDAIDAKFREAAWLSGMGHHAATMNLYSKLVSCAEEQSDRELRSDALACLATSVWHLNRSVGQVDLDWCRPVIEDAATAGVGSAAEARALLTGAWIFSDGGKMLDSVAVGFLERAQAVVATFPLSDVSRELAVAMHLTRELAQVRADESPVKDSHR